MHIFQQHFLKMQLNVDFQKINVNIKGERKKKQGIIISVIELYFGNVNKTNNKQ